MGHADHGLGGGRHGDRRGNGARMRPRAAADRGDPRNLPGAQAAALQARSVRQMTRLCAFFCALFPLAAAADAVSDIALYTGADRAERLAAGARKEGSLTLYTSLTVEDMAALNSAFEARHGVKVRMWRATSDKVVQRVLTEAKAGRYELDIVETN